MFPSKDNLTICFAHAAYQMQARFELRKTGIKSFQVWAYDDLVKRIWMHRTEVLPGFTKDYGVKMLVWYEVHESRESAFQRERQIKKWNRAWKLELIETMNPGWRDLYEEIAS